MWEGLGLNLFSTAVGIIVDLILVYIIIDRLLKKRENQRWKPVRILVTRRISDLSSILLSTSKSLIQPDNQELNKYLSLAGYEYNIALKKYEKLKDIIDLNAHGFDSELMPKITDSLEHFEKIIEKIQFFSTLHHQDKQNLDFVSEPPFQEFRELEEIIKLLKSKYSKEFKDEDKPSNTIEEVEQQWKETEKLHKRLHLNETEYRCDGTKTP